jgi:hypothetical protein
VANWIAYVDNTDSKGPARPKPEPIHRVSPYLLATVPPRFHTESDLPPEAGAGLLTLS